MLRLENIHKKLDDFDIRQIDLEIDRGDYFVILGKSGAGKTLVLEMIAGLLKPDKGTIRIEEEDITGKPIQKRNVGLVFQDHAVFPHKTVFQNIAYSLKGTKNKKQKVYQLAEKVQVKDLLHRYPSTLSGGELQRTILARTLAADPHVLLLDEPLASLDVQYKRELQSLLRSLHKQGQTIIHVTHDYGEAMSLADKVAVMHEGRIVQQGDVHEVFRNPGHKFIADFVGIKNYFRGTVETIPGEQYKEVRVTPEISFKALSEMEEQSECIVVVEAQGIILSNQKMDSTALNNFKGNIKDIIPSLNGLEVVVDIGVDMAAIISEKSLERLQLAKEKEVWMSFKASAVILKSI